MEAQHALPAAAFALGAFAGRVAANYNPALSLRTNVVGILLNSAALIPVEPINSEDEAKKAIVAARKRWNGVLPACKRLGMMPRGGTFKWASCTARDGAEVRVMLCRATEAPPKRKLPVICLIHGGGFAFGTIEAYQPMALHLAKEVGAVVALVEYRLAPEHRFPVPLHDTEDAVSWVWSNPAVLNEFGADPREAGIALLGDSAGGNLAAVVAVKLKHKIPFALQALAYPVTTLAGSDSYTSSSVRLSDAFVLPERALTLCKCLYLSDVVKESRNPYASPLLFSHADLGGTAPALVITGSADPLWTEGQKYFEKLSQAGVPAEHVHFKGEIHGFLSVNLTAHYHAGMRALVQSLRLAFRAEERAWRKLDQLA